MRKRTLAREYALQILYQMDITHNGHNEVMDNFWHGRQEKDLSDEVMAFARDLVRGVSQNLEAIDKKIAQYATNWELKRMAFVDRNVLRLGGYELMFREDIPPKVSINEAVELAKKYSSLEAAKFVNGILDKIKLEKEK